jgi:subtilase family serine protease
MQKPTQKIMLFLGVIFISIFCAAGLAQASYHFSNYKGTPPIHESGAASKTPVGMTPDEIKKIYNLPPSGGRGTIVIVGAYDDATIEADLAAFNKTFNLPACTAASGCFTKHAMSNGIKTNSGWAMETSLDVEWAHALAPAAKIFLVEAATQSGANLLKAVDYAASVKDASAISMSWGGGEFPEEVSLDSHFVSKSDAPFFASSGDAGHGASWPASSPNVIGVGGTSIAMQGGTFKSESAWSGSGGGVSQYEKEPAFQTGYNIAKAGGMRAVPDVSYDADPKSGFPIYVKGAWHTVGGTSAGAPQWAAIASLSNGNISNAQLYADKSSGTNAKYFRDITSGNNGSCNYFCTARAHYDYVTGLGSPQTSNF